MFFQGGRPFEVVQANDGRRILVFLEEGGGRRQVQTLSPQSQGIVEAFPRDLSSLSRRQRRGLESLRRDLIRRVRRRTNWSRYTIQSDQNGTPELVRRRSRRQRALSRNDVIHMIRVINQYLSGELATSGTTSSLSTLFSSQMTSPLTSTFRSSSTTFNPTTSTTTLRTTTTLRPISVVSSTTPSSRISESQRMMQQLKEEEQRLVSLMQTTTSPTTRLATVNTIVNRLKDNERQILQELANLERTTILPPTSQVTPSLASRESILNKTRADIAVVTRDLQRVQSALLQRLHRGDIMNNERNTQSNAELIRLRNMERNLLQRRRFLQESQANQISHDRIQPIAKERRDEIMTSINNLLNGQQIGTAPLTSDLQKVNTIHSKFENVLLSLEKVLSKDEQLFLIHILGEIEKGIKVDRNNAQLNQLLQKLYNLLPSTDYVFIRDLLLGDSTENLTKPITLQPPNTLSGFPSNQVQSFHTSDIDKIAQVVQSHLQPQELEVVLKLISMNQQNGSHLQTPYVRLILQKLQKMLTFSEYKTLERLINGGNGQNQHPVAHANAVNPRFNPATQEITQIHHQLNPLQHQQIDNNNMPPSTSEFVGQQTVMQQQNQPSALTGQTGIHPLGNVPATSQVFPGVMNQMIHPMFPRLPSAFMQELMFGDTTDPPDIPDPSTPPPTKAPEATVLSSNIGIVDKVSSSSTVKGGDMAFYKLPTSTPNPNFDKGNNSKKITSHINTIMNVLKNSGIPKNVKLEFHLPQQMQVKKESLSTVENKAEPQTPHVFTPLAKPAVTFPFKLEQNAKNTQPDRKKDYIILNNQQSQVFAPFDRTGEATPVRVQVHDTQPKNKPTFRGPLSNPGIQDRYQVISESHKDDLKKIGANISNMKTSNYIGETPVVYEDQQYPRNVISQNKRNSNMSFTNLIGDRLGDNERVYRRKPPAPKSVEELEQMNKRYFQIPLKQLFPGPFKQETPKSDNPHTTVDVNRRVLPTAPPSQLQFKIQSREGNIQNIPSKAISSLLQPGISNQFSNKMASGAVTSEIRLGPILPTRQMLTNTEQSKILDSTKNIIDNSHPYTHVSSDSNVKPTINFMTESKNLENINQGIEMNSANKKNVIHYTKPVSNKPTEGIPVTLPPQQASFSVPQTNQFLQKTTDHGRKWEDVKKLEKAADNQIKNVILHSGGQVKTSFWDNLIQQAKSGTSSNQVIKINLDSNLLESPLLNEKKTNVNNPKMEEVEAEDTTTTTTTTTTTAKPNEEFRMEIHTSQDGVSKISIIPQATEGDKHNSKCTPSSEDFRCSGVVPFDAVKSIGTWCLAKCLQGSCVETVCNCSCDKRLHSFSDHSQGENMAFALTKGDNSNSTQIQATLNEIYSSLKENTNSQAQTSSNDLSGRNENYENVQRMSVQSVNNRQSAAPNDPMNVQFLLRSIEGMIENKLRGLTPTKTSPPPEEEVEAEDIVTTTPPSNNNWNNNGNNDNNNGNNNENYNNNNNWNNNGNNKNWKNNENDNNWNNNGNNNNNNNWNNNENNNNWNNNGNNNNNNWNNNGNNNNNNWNNNGNNNNNGNGWNNNMPQNGHSSNNNNNGNWNNQNNGNNWNNNGNNGNNNPNNWNNNNNNNNNWNNNWNNGNQWGNNGQNNGQSQNGNWNGPNNFGWNGPPPYWNQGQWNNGGGPNNHWNNNQQWNNWGRPGNWNMAFSRRNQWQGGEGAEAAD
ncbi:uncharacterized protein LOC133189268 [Saccostrea echinata]|uniref:uncharacterized protein LOC133189268 n=1 Tax=Saccostrea echinata TaxID=191078 RepID=UPI002A838CB7|nr:uncharacterized protein LOC133189268 [Saccostrea echinata]